MNAPNVQRLIVHYMTTIMVPAGGGISAAISALSSREKITSAVQLATKFANDAITLVRLSSENPHRDDEAIAGAIMEAVDKRLRERASLQKAKDAKEQALRERYEARLARKGVT